MQIKKYAKFCAIALAGSILLSSTGFAVSAKANTNTAAAPSAAATANKAKDSFGRHPGGKGLTKAERQAGFLVGLKTAVAADIITQAESDKIQAFITDNKTTGKKDLFNDLVAKGILTQAKADALQESFRARRELKRQEQLKTEIAKLVTDKTITQVQADKIIAAMNTADAARKAAFDKAKTMSEADAKAYLDNFRKAEAGPLKSLVTNGTITQAQADKVGAALHQGRGPEGGGIPKGGKCPNGRGCGMTSED